MPQFRYVYCTKNQINHITTAFIRDEISFPLEGFQAYLENLQNRQYADMENSCVLQKKDSLNKLSYIDEKQRMGLQVKHDHKGDKNFNTIILKNRKLGFKKNHWLILFAYFRFLRAQR